MKLCAKCRIKKEDGDFHKNKYNKDGLSSFCKLCMAIYYEKNRERISARKKELYLQKKG